MAYQVLARKYRPLLFSDVVGQDHVTRTLLNALAAAAHRPRLHLQRPSRHRQDHHRAHPRLARSTAVTSLAARSSAPHPSPATGLRLLPRNPSGQRRRRHRNRRRHQPRHRRNPRAPRRRALPPLTRQVQDLHPRREPTRSPTRPSTHSSRPSKSHPTTSSS